jgi:ribosomal protein S18 acetylase RimI-like enzyme
VRAASTLIIRPATQNDDLIAIWREVYEAHHVPLLPIGVHVPFEPRGEAYTAELDGYAAGFFYVDTDWLDELWVRNALQGRGMGTALIQFAETLMRDRGIPEASLSVLHNNARAIALYRR